MRVHMFLDMCMQTTTCKHTADTPPKKKRAPRGFKNHFYLFVRGCVSILCDMPYSNVR